MPAARELDWQSRYDLGDALGMTIAWYRETAAGGDCRRATLTQIDAHMGRMRSR